MSSTISGSSTARDAVEQYLQNNPGWHEVADIRDAIGYTHSHTLQTCKRLHMNNDIDGRKNYRKRVIGYDINGDLKVPGDSRQKLINIIQTYGFRPYPNFGTMSTAELQQHVRDNVANGVVPLDAKWEFRKP